MGPLPLSNGNQHILFFDRRSFLEVVRSNPNSRPICPYNSYAPSRILDLSFGCHHSLHGDQGRNFESNFFKALNQALQEDKSKTTAFRPHSNAVVERMDRTLQSMLAKCINEEESNRSQQLPYVMMAYRTSKHESTGYTPYFLVLVFMYPSPIDQSRADIHDFVSAQKIQFQKAYNSARWALNFNQRRRNAVYNRKVHGPTYQVDQNVLLHDPLFPPVNHKNSLALAKAHMLSYNASTT